MDKKLIFLDIDGTILAPGKGISQGVKEGLKEARARGHQVFVCTGRSCHMLPEELEDVELETEGYISPEARAYIDEEMSEEEEIDRKLIE